MKKNVPSRLSPQWLCGNSCTWAHDVRLHIAGRAHCFHIFIGHIVFGRVFMIAYILCSSCISEI